MTNKQALREAAEKATKGEWAVEFDDEVYSTDGVNSQQIAMVFSENESLDAAFIAAASPVTVLALLDELEDYKAAYEEYARDKEVQRSVIDNALCKLLPGCQYMDQPDGGSVMPLEQVRRMVDDYRERIAELEAREVSSEIIDQTCLAAAEINNLGKGVSDDKAQFIIDRIRNYLEHGGQVQTNVADHIKGEG